MIMQIFFKIFWIFGRRKSVGRVAKVLICFGVLPCKVTFAARNIPAGAKQYKGHYYQAYTDASSYVCEWDGYDIQLNETSLKMKPGESGYLQYTVKDINGKSVNKSASWTSSNIKVAKVSSKGKVVAVAPGNCTITCKVGDNKKTVKIVVLPKRVTNVSAIAKNTRSIQLKQAMSFICMILS